MKITVSELRKIIRESLSKKFLDLFSGNKENMEVTDLPAGKMQHHTIGDDFERVSQITAASPEEWKKWSAYQDAVEDFEKQTGIDLHVGYEIDQVLGKNLDRFERISKPALRKKKLLKTITRKSQVRLL